MLYACDDKWWDKYRVEIDFAGECWTQDNAVSQRYGINRVRGKNASGLGRDCVHFGGNSGYQCINLAYLWGARRIVLLGMDMQIVNGKSHWFGDHPKGLNGNSPYAKWLKRFDQLALDLKAEGVEVINCSPASALTQFPKCPIESIA